MTRRDCLMVLAGITATIAQHWLHAWSETVHGVTLTLIAVAIGWHLFDLWERAGWRCWWTWPRIRFGSRPSPLIDPRHPTQHQEHR